MLIATNSMEEMQENMSVVEVFRHRTKRLEAMGLDVNSCLQFLIDYYTQLMRPQVSRKIGWIVLNLLITVSF